MRTRPLLLRWIRSAGCSASRSSPSPRPATPGCWAGWAGSGPSAWSASRAPAARARAAPPRSPPPASGSSRPTAPTARTGAARASPTLSAPSAPPGPRRPHVDPNTGVLAIAERIAAVADPGGLEYVGIQDHPCNAEFVDTLTMITWLAGRTSRVHFFPNVANLPLRPPAMLAKQAATIDMLSGGRFELGLGAGAFTQPITSLGSPSRTPAQAPMALSE